MADENHLELPRRNVRLDTLVRLRWLSIAGQTATVLTVYFGLEFDLPLFACLAVIALAAGLNVALRIRFRHTQRLDPDRAAWLLAFDIAELAVLLFLTGGMENPFAFLFLGPVLLSATALPPRMTLLLGGFAILCASVLAVAHYPLPWAAEDPLDLPSIYVLGNWISILLAIGFIGIYAWQITEESRQLADALAATELVLAREQHLSALDGLAAAAAHELGTPLSTVVLVVRELERDLPKDGPHADDIKLLREQTERCRSILATLTTLGSGGAPFDRMPLSLLVEEIAAPHRPFGVEIMLDLPLERADEPVIARNPGIIYGLGNFVENAVDFARGQVAICARWDADAIAIEITDDGPGFSPAVIDRIGEPYVTMRGSRRNRAAIDDSGGLGLGYFIAKTLLERTGAKLDVANRPAPALGAIVRVSWPRRALEQAGAAFSARPARLNASATDLAPRPVAT